jgi:hypothetical protein
LFASPIEPPFRIIARRIAQEQGHHLGRGQIFDDAAHPRRGTPIQECRRGLSEPILVSLLFDMATGGEVIAKYANATNRRPACLRQTLGRGIALRDLRKEIEFESSFDGGSLLIGEDGVHEQIRRDVGHVYAQ